MVDMFNKIGSAKDKENGKENVIIEECIQCIV